LTFSPDTTVVALAFGDNTVRLWNVTHVAYTAHLKGHKGWVLAMAFSPDGRTLATASHDGTIRLWDVARLKDPVP
jgi:WD40 repeat protein